MKVSPGKYRKDGWREWLLKILRDREKKEIENGRKRLKMQEIGEEKVEDGTGKLRKLDKTERDKTRLFGNDRNSDDEKWSVLHLIRFRTNSEYITGGKYRSFLNILSTIINLFSERNRSKIHIGNIHTLCGCHLEGTWFSLYVNRVELIFKKSRQCENNFFFFFFHIYIINN